MEGGSGVGGGGGGWTIRTVIAHSNQLNSSSHFCCAVWKTNTNTFFLCCSFYKNI